MKKSVTLITLLLLFVFGLSSTAQNQLKKIIDAKNNISSQIFKLDNPKQFFSNLSKNEIAFNEKDVRTSHLMKENGQGIIRSLTERWENNQWVNVNLISYEFDENQRVTGWLTQKWINNAWVNHIKTTTQLNEDYFPVEDIGLLWDNNNWINFDRTTYQYNSNNDMTGMVWQEWNDTTNNWQNFFRSVLEYDNNFNNIDFYMEMWENSNWASFMHSEYTYDQNNLMTISKSEMWFDTEWMDQSKVTYTYDAQQYRVEELHQIWNFVSSSWANSEHWTYEYNGSGLVLVTLIEDFDPYTQTRTDYTKISSTYNGDLLIEELYQDWTGSEWLNSEIRLYTYENNFLAIILHQEWENNNWVNIERWTNTYGDPVSVTSSNTLPSNFYLAQNFPNPFNPTTTIEYNIPGNNNGLVSTVMLKIYDVLGNEIKSYIKENQAPGVYQVEINFRGLTSGVYYYKLQSGSFSETKKCILLK